MSGAATTWPEVFREELAAAARHLLRTIRVVVVDTTENQDVVGEFGITRCSHQVQGDFDMDNR